LDDSFATMIKCEKNKLKLLRSELNEKKRALVPARTGKSKSKSSSSASSKTQSPEKENSNSNSISIEVKRPTSRQQVLLNQQEEKEQSAKILEIEKLDAKLKQNQLLFDNKRRMQKLENERKKWKILTESRTHLRELGMDRYYNKYFWNLYGDGRIFVLHPNKEWQSVNGSEQAYKYANPWEIWMDDVFCCWSFVTKTSDFYALLQILDERGLRENELLLRLNALKDEIVRSMACIDNDDAIESMDVDKEEDAPPQQLRRSKRATRNNAMDQANVCEFVQSNKKDFSSYRNKLKKK